MSTQTDNLLILADITELVNTVKATCEAGIYPSIFIPNSKGKQVVMVKFDVKVMANGVRKNFGPFYSYEAAVKAKWEYKRSGREIRAEEELQAIVQMKALISDVPHKAGSVATHEVLSSMTIKKEQHPIAESRLKELSALLLTVPSHKILCETSIEIVHPETNVIHVVSPREQSEWLQWYYTREESTNESMEQEDTLDTADKNSDRRNNKEGDVNSGIEGEESPLRTDVQSIDDPEIQAMLKRIEEMGDEN